MPLKTYDPKQVAIIVGGVLLAGFAEDRMVTVNRGADAWTKKVGTDGEVTRSKSNDKSGEFTIFLMQSSASNMYLSGLAILDELSNEGVVPVLVKDNSGLSLYSAAEAWIVKMPDAELGREAGVREWKLQCADLIPYEAGN